MMGLLNSIWYRFTCFTLREVVFRSCGGIKTKDIENVPLKGGLLIAANHVSYFDPPAIAATFPRRAYYMAKQELFVGWFGKLLHSLGAFPVKRGATDIASIKLAISILNKDKALLLFPEGTRGDGIKLSPFNSGVSMLAKKSGAAILPVGICGTHKLLPKENKKRIKSTTTVVYGQPFFYKDYATATSESENKNLVNLEIRRRIIEACKLGGMEILDIEQQN